MQETDMKEHFSNVPNTFQQSCTGSETSNLPSWWEPSLAEEAALRSVVEELAFQALCQASWVQGLPSQDCDLESVPDPDFLSLTFPRKLWTIVESDKFKSIWWGEEGTSVVINEDLFKEEILGRKYPFKIFETNSMKSVIRQLNLYGFSKLHHQFDRSASLLDFLTEEEEGSSLRKFLCYQNPNFKQGCPELLARIRRKVRIKKFSVTSESLPVQLDEQLHLGHEGNASNPKTDLVSDTSTEGILSTSRSSLLSHRPQPSGTHMLATAAPLLKNDNPVRDSSVRHSHKKFMDQGAMSSHLTTLHVLSNNSYLQAHDCFLNFDKSYNSQYQKSHRLSNDNFREMMPTSAIPIGYSYFMAYELPHSSMLVTASNQRCSDATTREISAAAFSKYHHIIAPVYKEQKESNIPSQCQSWEEN